ncbi:terminase TerL endonuclease subunit, partial [Brevundimonas aurantiaca]|uniref:terminase TerL endonuclease subunit n=1 Tax=Brevundimonas aurantiaca TaxID=74316 RepID=UPI001CD75E30
LPASCSRSTPMICASLNLLFFTSVSLMKRTLTQNEGSGRGRLSHANNPILTWCMSNAVVTKDPAGNRKLDKSRATGRIDGAVALAMALHAMDLKPEAEGWEPWVDAA